MSSDSHQTSSVKELTEISGTPPVPELNFVDKEDIQNDDFLQMPTSQQTNSQNPKAGFWRFKRRTFRYLKSTRVGHAEGLVGPPASVRIQKSTRPGTAKFRRSQLRLSSSGHRRRFQPPKRMESIQLIIDDDDKERRVSSHSGRSDCPIPNNISTIKDDSGDDVKEIEPVLASNFDDEPAPTSIYFPTTTKGSASLLQANSLMHCLKETLLQIDNTTASQLFESGEILFPVSPTSSDEMGKDDTPTSPKSLILPAITLKSVWFYFQG